MTVPMSATKLCALALGIALFPACGELVDENSTEQALQPPPANVMAAATSSTRITVSWDDVPGAIKYYVYRSTAGGPYAYIASARAPATSLVVANLSPNTEYCFELKTDDGAGVSDSSLPGCATTPGVNVPAPPASVDATATSSSRITVEWPADAGATKYYIYQSVGSAGPFDLAGSVTAPEVVFLAGSLLPNSTYCYKVAAANANGASAPSTEIGCDKTFVAGLEAYYKLDDSDGFAEDHSGQGRDGLITGGAGPSSDRAPLDNNKQAILVPGAVTDGISIADAAPFWMTGPFTLATWVKIPSASASAVRIAGKRVAGCGDVTWELAQDPTNGLHVKGRFGAVSAFGSSISVGVWTHVAITYSGGTLRKYVDGLEVSSGPFTPGSRTGDPLQLGNSGACGGASVMVDAVQIHSRELTGEEVSTLGTRPPAPTNLVATAACATRVNLAWDAVPGAFKYFVYKGSAPSDQQYVASVRAPTTTFSDGQLSHGQQTSWVVRSVQNGIYSESSNEQVVVTSALPAPPTGVTASVTSAGRIQVDWEPVAGATKYFIYQSVAGGAFTYRATILGSNPPTFVTGNLLANTMYSYRLRVEVPCATSVDSAEASATTP
jgi:fibronectin type 3 domain-containing protein